MPFPQLGVTGQGAATGCPAQGLPGVGVGQAGWRVRKQPAQHGPAYLAVRAEDHPETPGNVIAVQQDLGAAHCGEPLGIGHAAGMIGADVRRRRAQHGDENPPARLSELQHLTCSGVLVGGGQEAHVPSVWLLGYLSGVGQQAVSDVLGRSPAVPVQGARLHRPVVADGGPQGGHDAGDGQVKVVWCNGHQRTSCSRAGQLPRIRGSVEYYRLTPPGQAAMSQAAQEGAGPARS